MPPTALRHRLLPPGCSLSQNDFRNRLGDTPRSGFSPINESARKHSLSLKPRVAHASTPPNAAPAGRVTQCRGV